MNLNDWTCGCKLWQLSGIPCRHVVSTIWANREQPEAYCHQCYSKDVYLKTYNFIIKPVPSHHEWVHSNFAKIQPPLYHKPCGRPRKLRRKAANEPKNQHKQTRKGGTVTCARCLTLGHNSRACTLPFHPKSRMN